MEIPFLQISADVKIFQTKMGIYQKKHKIFFLRRHDFVSPPQNTPKVLWKYSKIEKGIRCIRVCCVEDAQGDKNGANFISTNYIEKSRFRQNTPLPNIRR